MEDIVRLSSVEICNIKNVKNGKIMMPNTLRRERTAAKAEVLGIYGQNGSGKTALIDTLYYLQKIMVGEPVGEDFREYIDVDEEAAQLAVDFYIFGEEAVYEVTYRIVLQKKGWQVQIQRETLSCAKDIGGVKGNKTPFMDYRREQDHVIFLPKKRQEEVLAGDKENKTNLIVAKKMAEKSNCSYIFGENSREIFCQEYQNGFRDCADVIRALFLFALKDLFVIRNTHSGMISANFLLPMAFQLEQRGKNPQGRLPDMYVYKGNFAIPLKEPVLLEAGKRTLLLTLTEQINMVLPTIIPGMKIGVRDYGMQMMDSGADGYKLELVSLRDGVPAIPIRMESEGIIKIISVLNVLIQAFANPSICLAIDELDAGIFEYMLGELLDIFENNAKGQLIFTSHDLRALEMLDKDSIMFSTANPKRRYIHMKNIKTSNNLRDVYLRGITLGGQEEVIYEATDSLKIARAFRKAGRSIRNG